MRRSSGQSAPPKPYNIYRGLPMGPGGIEPLDFRRDDAARPAPGPFPSPPQSRRALIVRLWHAWRSAGLAAKNGSACCPAVP